MINKIDYYILAVRFVLASFGTHHIYDEELKDRTYLF